MNKKDLKTGMLVLTRDGTIFLVINDSLISNNGWDDLKDYRDDLTIIGLGTSDIVKVSKILEGVPLQPKHWDVRTLNDNLLWSRDRTIEIENHFYKESYLLSLIKANDSLESF